ncbi:hypothetical protein STRTUCAR8_03144, partial [Streptomyces turgidiscabies Car8]
VNGLCGSTCPRAPPPRRRRADGS